MESTDLTGPCTRDLSCISLYAQQGVASVKQTCHKGLCRRTDVLQPVRGHIGILQRSCACYTVSVCRVPPHS